MTTTMTTMAKFEIVALLPVLVLDHARRIQGGVNIINIIIVTAAATAAAATVSHDEQSQRRSWKRAIAPPHLTTSLLFRLGSRSRSSFNSRGHAPRHQRRKPLRRILLLLERHHGTTRRGNSQGEHHHRGGGERGARRVHRPFTHAPRYRQQQYQQEQRPSCRADGRSIRALSSHRRRGQGGRRRTIHDRLGRHSPTCPKSSSRGLLFRS
mmetsp:Transcript_12682/g.27411  ORF Transcript_12682/g.27411 Transcript_12682/m.27411 type:complete len:210 (+) Transcript_12682:1-630(+)